ncbi:hypothetical protein ZWY2020_016098 [Hordeum vulgare]|nr:hypothetical protein ZWY2020_016098 [Hordeum vulgare]
MNTDITASVKPEYPVMDRNPPFTKVVGNFCWGTPHGKQNFLRARRPIMVMSIYERGCVIYVPLIKPGIHVLLMVTVGLIGVLGEFMYAYQNSVGRFMGFFPNEFEVARYKCLYLFFY